MTASKNDRTIAPRHGSRASRAKDTKGRATTPPAAKAKRPSKPKKGERVMEAQLAAKSPTAPPAVIDVDVVPDKDPWWTDDRERAYAMTLQGFPPHQVAKDLERDRHTIARWLQDERFVDRLQSENVDRFRASRQRRTMQTLRVTDKVHTLVDDLLDKAIAKPNDVLTRVAAQSWLNEYRENSRREDEIYGLDKQRVDVNVHGGVVHTHKGSVANVSFKEFLTGAMKKLGVDVETEEIDASRADDALVAVTERALMEGTFLEELVEREKQEQLRPLVPTNER